VTNGIGEAERIDFDILYLSARSWEIQPSEFWDMTFGEWFAEYEWRKPQDKGKANGHAGTLTDADIERLQKMRDEDLRNGATRN